MDLWWGHNNIQIWTCDEGNMDFMDLRQQYWLRQSRGQYCCWRSIKPTLPNSIGQYLLYYMLNVYGWSPLVYEYIYCWYVFNNLLPFPVLQSVAWCYYCDIILSFYNIRYHGSTRVTFLSNNSTIWHHNSSTMMRGQYWKILPGQYGILSQYAPLLKVIWPGIDQSALSIYIWHTIKIFIY